MAVDMDAGNAALNLPPAKGAKVAKMGIRKNTAAKGNGGSTTTHTSQTPLNRASTAAVKKVAIKGKGTAAGGATYGKGGK